jgi:PAS domain S-box-containing protein
MLTNNTNLRTHLDVTGKICSVSVVLIASFILFCWFLGIEKITQIKSDYIPMAPTTSIGFIFTGLSLFAIIRWYSYRKIRIINSVVITVCLCFSFLLFMSFIYNVEFILEDFLSGHYDEMMGNFRYGRMSPITSISFILSCSALLFLIVFSPERKFFYNISAILSLCVMIINFIVTIGYFYDTPLFYGGTMIPVALTTSINFLILSTGLLSATKENSWIINRLFGPSIHAFLLRFFLPSIIILIIFNGWLDLIMLYHLSLNRTLVISLSVLISISIIIPIIYTVASKICYIMEKTRNEVKEREELNRLILSTALEGFCLVDTERRLLKVNASYSKMTGYTVEELVEMRIHELDVMKSSDEIDGHMKDLATKGFGIFESRHRCKNGSVIDVEISTRFIPSIDCFFAFIRDITERKKDENTIREINIRLQEEILEHKRTEKERFNLETKLRQSQKMEAIGTLAGGIAHDFNNILAIIMGRAELIMIDEDKIGKNSLMRDNLDNILKACNRAKELVKQILTFSRQAEQEKKPVKICKVIEEAIDFVRSTIPSDIEIIRNIDDKTGLVLADQTQIHQIILNLCTNAYHAMKDNGGIMEINLVKITFDKNNNEPYYGLDRKTYVELSVKDTGTGMDKLTMERIFEPYFTTKSFGEGTGMGLSVVHGIVKNHGGEIKVYSEKGKGSIFKIYLPVVETDEKIEADIEIPLLSGSGRILFVDDEADIVKISKKMLESLGYEVIDETDSLEALNIFTRDPDIFDLVITDYSMPKMTGLELAKKILDLKPEIPVILCSGNLDNLNAEKSRKIGIRGFIDKPFRKRIIAEMVQKVLKGM